LAQSDPFQIVYVSLYRILFLYAYGIIVSGKDGFDVVWKDGKLHRRQENNLVTVGTILTGSITHI